MPNDAPFFGQGSLKIHTQEVFAVWQCDLVQRTFEITIDASYDNQAARRRGEQGELARKNCN